MKKLTYLFAALLCWGMAQATSTHVASFTDLQSAIATSADTIIVDSTIVLLDGTTLDGSGKVIMVPVPYMDADGRAHGTGYSEFTIFHISSGAHVVLKNMTLLGGRSSDAGCLEVNSSYLYAENVQFSRAYRGVSFYGSSAVLKNCNVVRNVCEYGGGMLLGGASKVLMDGCSLSENRSLSSSGGGGAMEVQYGCAFYGINTIIANNCSSEIGGAINLNNGHAYLLACTVSGNTSVSGDGKTTGGAIGINGGRVFSANSVVMDNYHFPNLTGEKSRSDFGMWSASETSLYLYNTIYGSVTDNDEERTFSGANYVKATETDPVYTAYRHDGVLAFETDQTQGFKHSILTAKSGSPFSLYAPLRTLCATGGTACYAEYDSTLTVVKMGFDLAGAITPLGELTAPEAGKKITTYYEGTTRVDGTIGASAIDLRSYWTLKLDHNIQHSHVNGLTIFGDSYLEGEEVVISATADDGYVVNGWRNCETGELVSTSPTYSITISEDMMLIPSVTLPGDHIVFVPSAYNVKVVTADQTLVDLNDNGYPADTTIVIQAACPMGKEFECWVNAQGDTISTDNPLNVYLSSEDIVIFPILKDEVPEFDANGFVDGTHNMALAHPWGKYSGKPGVSFASYTMGMNSSSAIDTLTLTPQYEYPYMLFFDWAVSSEGGCDKYTVAVGDNVIVNNVSGVNSGSFASPDSISGITKIALNYSKDGSVASGEDRAYIYNIWCKTRPFIFEEDTTILGTSFVWRGKTLTESGVYADTLRYPDNAIKAIYKMDLTLGTWEYRASNDTLYAEFGTGANALVKYATIAQSDFTYCGDTAKATMSLQADFPLSESDLTISYVDANDAAVDYAIAAGSYKALLSYDGNVAEAPFTINKKAATVTAQDNSKIYGDTDPTFAMDTTGLVAGDVLTGISISRAEGENVDTYAIQATAEEASNPNYELTFVPATFTINKKAATVKANDASKTYGDLDPEFTYTATGLVGEDVLLNIELTRAAGETIGTYVITAHENAPTSAPARAEEFYINNNYNLSFETGLLTISQMALDEEYGSEENEFFSVSAAGYCHGDEAGILYDIKAGNPIAYSIVFGSKAKEQGFKDVEKKAIPAGETKTLDIVIPENCHFGKYTADVYFHNALDIEPIKEPVVFMVNIPVVDIKALFNDVVAIDNNEGLYTSYQWYHNGELIPGATNQYYQEKGGLTGSYYVEVTVEGLEYNAVSCVEEFDGPHNAPAAQKIIRSNELIIITPEGHEYSAKGQVIK